MGPSVGVKKEPQNSTCSSKEIPPSSGTVTVSQLQSACETIRIACILPCIVQDSGGFQIFLHHPYSHAQLVQCISCSDPISYPFLASLELRITLQPTPWFIKHKGLLLKIYSPSDIHTLEPQSLEVMEVSSLTLLAICDSSFLSKIPPTTRSLL